MILTINNLKLPALTSSTSELINDVVTKRTVSGRLITKTAYSKWRVNVNFDAVAMSLSFQADFYRLCTLAKSTPVTITLVSPYDNQVKRISAKCISLNLPNIASLNNRRPSLYTQAGAVFEEI